MPAWGPKAGMTGCQRLARSPRYVHQDQPDQGVRARRTGGTGRAGPSRKVPDQADQASQRLPGRLPPRYRPVTSMPLQSPCTARASGRAGRCPSASWRRHLARPHDGGRATGWPKPGRHRPRFGRVHTDPSTSRQQRYSSRGGRCHRPGYLNSLLPNYLDAIRQDFAGITVFPVTLRECRLGCCRAYPPLFAAS